MGADGTRDVQCGWPRTSSWLSVIAFVSAYSSLSTLSLNVSKSCRNPHTAAHTRDPATVNDVRCPRGLRHSAPLPRLDSARRHAWQPG